MNLNPQNCANLTDPTSKSLCQTLTNPTNRDMASPRAFTGMPATDIIILAELSDRDLINTCSSNKYLNDLCNNESFWMNRTLQRYSKVLGGADNIRQYLPGNTTWKQYYIWLSDLETDLSRMLETAETYERPDLNIILDQPIYVDNVVRELMNRIANETLAASHSISTRRIFLLALRRYERRTRTGQSSPAMREILNNGILDTNSLSPGRQAVLNDPTIINHLEKEIRFFRPNGM